MKTLAVTVVVGAQITINNQLKVGAAMARETMTTTALTMTMKTKGSMAAAVAAWRRWAAQRQLGSSSDNGVSTAASTVMLPPQAVAVAMKTPVLQSR
jgi:hypothetical protein